MRKMVGETGAAASVEPGRQAHDVSWRELMPQDLKIEIDRLSQDDATSLAAYLAGVVGRAHGRQMDEFTRASLLKELDTARTTNLDAPSWLWSSVVDLLSVHEAA